MCSNICFVKRFLFSSKRLQENTPERVLAKEDIKSNASAKFSVLFGSRTRAMSEEQKSSRKVPGIFALTRLNRTELFRSLKVKYPLSSKKKL